MKFYRQKLNTDFIRVCRIQYNSLQRNKNLYPDHYYEIECKLGNIYSVDRVTDFKKYKLEIYLSDDKLYITNNRQFFVKETIIDEDKYIDIGIMIPSYSTNIDVNINTVNPGSVTFFCDSAIQTDYTRIDYKGNTPIAMLFNTSIMEWTNSNFNISIAKTNNRITDMVSGEVAYITDGKVFNGDNTAFTLTISETKDFNYIVNIVSKANANRYILIENMYS